MLYADGLIGLVLLGLWLFCLFDVITTADAECRNLPKLVWLLIVLMLPDIGSLIWLIAGRPRTYAPGPGRSTAYPEYDRPGRFAATNPDDDEEFLRQVRERAEEQRRRYREQQERAAEDDGPPET